MPQHSRCLCKPPLRTSIKRSILTHLRPTLKFRPMAKSQEKPEKERPNLSLLSVNNQVNKEATPILYSKADFNINTPANYTRFMQNLQHPVKAESKGLSPARLIASIQGLPRFSRLNCNSNFFNIFNYLALISHSTSPNNSLHLVSVPLTISTTSSPT